MTTIIRRSASDLVVSAAVRMIRRAATTACTSSSTFKTSTTSTNTVATNVAHTKLTEMDGMMRKMRVHAQSHHPRYYQATSYSVAAATAVARNATQNEAATTTQDSPRGKVIAGPPVIKGRNRARRIRKRREFKEVCHIPCVTRDAAMLHATTDLHNFADTYTYTFSCLAVRVCVCVCLSACARDMQAEAKKAKDQRRAAMIARQQKARDAREALREAQRKWAEKKAAESAVSEPNDNETSASLV